MSERENGPIFVWLTGVGGRLEGQKWSGLYRDFKGRMDKVLAYHPITNKQFLNASLDELSQAYPAPKAA